LKPHVLDVARRELWRGSEPVVVEPQVFDLLVYLVQHPERVVTPPSGQSSTDRRRRS
jgi:DNA-binding winged helix-turn-helix (wHTH) protein